MNINSENKKLPDISFPSTNGSEVLFNTMNGRFVIYIHPMISSKKALPEGWLSIPGASGCTAQSSSFRDHHSELIEQGTGLFGLSSQLTAEQQEAKNRLHLAKRVTVFSCG